MKLVSISPPDRSLKLDGWQISQHRFIRNDESSRRDCPDLVDVDVMICDLEQVEEFQSQVAYRIGAEIRERVMAGGVLIVFVGKPRYFVRSGKRVSSYQWLSGLDFSCRDRSGAEMEIVAKHEVGMLLRRFEKDCRWTCDLELSSPGPVTWVPIANNKLDRPIAALALYYKGLVVLLPRIRSQDDFLSRFIKDVLPVLAPQFKLPSIVRESPPTWAFSYLEQIPRVSELDRQISEEGDTIAELKKSIDSLKNQKITLEKWGSLLWETGLALEEVVRDALMLLGLANHKRDDVDTVVTDGGKECYVEIEGSVQSIKIDKARQLLQGISEAPDPASVHGAIVANPFRSDQPEQRPPDQNHKLFVREVEKMAEKYGWALITTTDLYQLVIRKLSGDDTVSDEIRERLLSS